MVAFLWSSYNLLRKKISVDTDIGLFIESLYILPFALIMVVNLFINLVLIISLRHNLSI